MVLAQGRFWRASVRKGRAAVTLAILRESLPSDLEEVRDLKIEVPFEDWFRVVKQIRSDRKLLGGILLDFAKNKDHLSVAVGNDRLFQSLQRVVHDTTAALVEEGVMTLVPVASEA
jgi:hypothetical protein